MRIAGIDAPERRQAFGERARERLAELSFQRDATLACGKVDRYGRSICLVRVSPAASTQAPHTIDEGLAMVSGGMAWWYRAYAHEQNPDDRRLYEEAERIAKGKRLGVWSDPQPVAPWDWRRPPE